MEVSTQLKVEQYQICLAGNLVTLDSLDDVVRVQAMIRTQEESHTNTQNALNHCQERCQQLEDALDSVTIEKQQLIQQREINQQIVVAQQREIVELREFAQQRETDQQIVIAQQREIVELKEIAQQGQKNMHELKMKQLEQSHKNQNSLITVFILVIVALVHKFVPNFFRDMCDLIPLDEIINQSTIIILSFIVGTLIGLTIPALTKAVLTIPALIKAVLTIPALTKTSLKEQMKAQ